MGRGYVIEHCVSTLNLLRKEDNYRIYLTEVLRGISKSVGCEIRLGYDEFMENSRRGQENAEERTPDEIIGTIKAKAELISNGSTESISQNNSGFD